MTADAGLIPDSPLAPVAGGLVSHGPGRTDTIAAHVKPEAYVIPADVVSALGEGNTLAGFVALNGMFPRGAAKEPLGAKGGPWGSTMPKPPKGRGLGVPHRAGGGVVADATPVALAGGEFVVEPEHVSRLGDGSYEKGHAVLDHFVEATRAETVKTLKKLPGPVK